MSTRAGPQLFPCSSSRPYTCTGPRLQQIFTLCSRARAQLVTWTREAPPDCPLCRQAIRALVVRLAGRAGPPAVTHVPDAAPVPAPASTDSAPPPQRPIELPEPHAAGVEDAARAQRGPPAPVAPLTPAAVPAPWPRGQTPDAAQAAALSPLCAAPTSGGREERAGAAIKAASAGRCKESAGAAV